MATATAICASPTASHDRSNGEVETGEEPSVQRLRIGGRHARQKAERPVLDAGVTANRSLLSTNSSRIVSRSRASTRSRGIEAARTTTSAAVECRTDTSRTMGATSEERYAVVSCHVERPLDDAVWARFALMQARRPGGFAIAALMRPADSASGEDEATWLERAREASARGPLGHHTHWTAPDHARPTQGNTGARVLTEGARMREPGLSPTLSCGGGWYTYGGR